MMRKVQLFLVGCLIVTLTSLILYNLYPTYVIPVPLRNIYGSANESLLRNVEFFTKSNSDRHMLPMPKIGRTLSKVEGSDGGGAESMQTSRLEDKASSTNLSRNAATRKPISTRHHIMVSTRNENKIEATGNANDDQPALRNNVTHAKNIQQAKQPGKYKLEQTQGRKIPAAVVVMDGTTQEVDVRSKLWLDHGTDSTCSPSLQNVAFIKTHKTGSTTMGHMINRFGYHYRLSFVLNKRRRLNGHLVYYNITKDTPRLMLLPPINVSPRDYKNYKYNVIAVHVRYNRPAMNSFMKPGTKYITIIRDPGSQFESAFSHFQFDDAFPSVERRNFTTTVDKLEHFLKKPIFYRDRLKLLSWENTPGLRWFYARNNQAFDLGLDHKYHMNTNIVEKFIDRLEREMTVVLLTEYLDESLLILRKKMCWTWSDILYVAKNRRPAVETLPALLREKMRSWNAVDSMLYNHFNRTLWKHVEEYGPEFASDLAFFKEMLTQVFNECVSNQYQKSQGRNFHWLEHKQRQGSSSECKLLVEPKIMLFRRIWERQQDVMGSMMKVSHDKLLAQTRRIRNGYYSRTKMNQNRKPSDEEGHQPAAPTSLLLRNRARGLKRNPKGLKEIRG